MNSRARNKDSCRKTLVAALALFLCLPAISRAATRQDLQNEINKLIIATDRDVAQDVEVINAVNFALAPALSLTMATVGSQKGATKDVPVYFKEGPSQVSALQFDVAASSNFSITSVVPGIAALAAGKGVQANLTGNNGATRVIVFGVNQTTLSSGPVAILKVAVPFSAVDGKSIIHIFGAVGSNPAGLNVPLTFKNGSLTVNK